MTNFSSSFRLMQSRGVCLWFFHSEFLLLLLPDPLFETHFFTLLDHHRIPVLFLKKLKRQSAEFSSIGQEHCEFPALLIHSKTSQDFSFVFAHRFLICIGEMHKPQIFVSRTWKKQKGRGRRKILWLYFCYFKTIYSTTGNDDGKIFF